MNSSTVATISELRRDEILSWAPLILTEERIQNLWNSLQAFPQTFDDFSRGKYDLFVKNFFNPSNVFIDIGNGVGLAAGFNVRPGLDAVLHLVMFDRRLRGRELLFKQIMRFFFEKLQLHRMTSVIGDDCKTAIKLVERLGFQKEGTLRGGILRDGKYVDVHMYGMLREELV